MVTNTPAIRDRNQAEVASSYVVAMPQAICDSEDEEELLVKDDEPSQRSRSSNFSYNKAIDLANQILTGSQGLDGAHDGSSLSTGEINRQIADTTRGFFFSSTTDNSKIMDAPRSSAKQKLSRRHTHVIGSATVAAPAKGLKRTQTTYGKGQSKTPRPSDTTAEEAAFQAYNNNERASQESLAFLQNSDTPKTADGLPGGTIMQDFQRHYPYALFPPDSGTTIENNESSQQRMLELARQSPVKVGNNCTKSPTESQDQESSFPWSASGKQTQTPKVDLPKSPMPEDAADGLNELNDVTSVSMEALEHDRPIVSAFSPATDTAGVAGATQAQNTEGVEAESRHFAEASAATPQQDEEQQQNQDDEVIVIEPQQNMSKTKSAPKSSPMVITSALETPRAEQPASVQKSSRNRKRKSMEAEPKDTQHQHSEPLNSDDRAVGLPKERYLPRPSRRRATAIAETIDFSVVPEKAIKKRRLTDGSPGESVADVSLPVKKKAISKSKVVPSNGTNSSTPLPSTRQHPGNDGDADLKAAIAASLRDMQQSTGSKPIVIGDEGTRAATPKASKPADWNEPDRPSGEDVSPLTSPDKPKSNVKPNSPDMPTNKAQDKPKPSPAAQKLSPTKMLPPTLPASATRRTPRRSQTTIFEDHASQRSPSLRQLQAERLAAIKDVPKPTQSNKRKRRTIVQSDADEEDEIAKVSPAQKPAPKKRGPPSKAANASRKVLDDTEEKDDSEDDMPTRNRRKPPSTAAKLANSETDGRKIAELQSTKRGKKSRPASRVLADSEDELEQLDEVTESVKPAKKKAPGRPPKPEATVHSDSEAEPGLDDNDEDSDAPPKKKALGRPVKAKSQASTATQKPTSKTALQPKDVNANTAAKKSAPPSKEPTPVPPVAKATPEPAAKHTTPAPTVNPSPNSHSPIKKKGMHRVGLGKRQRVQPLLKIIRPEARARKEDAARVTTITSVAELEAKWNEVPE